MDPKLQESKRPGWKEKVGKLFSKGNACLAVAVAIMPFGLVMLGIGYFTYRAWLAQKRWAASGYGRKAP